MNEVITLDENYSTTRRVIKVDQQNIADLVKQKNKPEHKFETVLFLPQSEGRQGEGGLRTQGYFKVGGIIHSHLSEDTSVATKPVITVVTVVFNGEKFLEETILSVINQTYDNVEYIIIDGGSTDGTLDIIKKYEHAIDYWVSEKDNGIYDAMNKGMTLAKGDYLIFMNSGDIFYDFYVLKNIFMQTDTLEFDIIFGKSISFYKYIEKLRYRDFRLNNKNWYCDWMPNHQAVFISRKIYISHKFNLMYNYNSDTVFLRKVFGLYSYKFVDQIVSKFEIGGTSNYYKNFKSFLLILKESYSLRGLSISTFSHILKYLLQKVLSKDIYLKLYLKLIVKE